MPRQSCHPFHTKAAAHSMASLPPIPWERCHGCHGKAATSPRDLEPRATLGDPIGILRFSHLLREEQMPAQRLAMRQVHEVVRLKWGQGLSERKIAQSLGLSRPTVAE
jgi:hypothetical protein